MPPCAAVVLVRAGRGAAAGRPRAARRPGTRKGASASSVTTQGLTEVAKLFARNGPSGWYSHFCTSRADQSLSEAQAEDVLLGLAERDRRAERVARAEEGADLELVVEARGWGRSAAVAAVGRLGLARGRAHGRAAHARATRRGRGSRSAPTCSSAAAGCRGGTSCRRSWRGRPRRRSRCSRRRAPAAASRRRPGGSEHLRRVGARRDEAALGAQQVAQPVPQRAAHARGSRAMRAFEARRRGRRPRRRTAGRAAGRARRRRARSRTWSPIAQPIRARPSRRRAGRRRAAGSGSGSRSRGRSPTRPSCAAPASCVPSIFGITRAPRARCRSATGSANEHEPKRRARSRAAPPRARPSRRAGCRHARPVVVEAEGRRVAPRAAPPRARPARRPSRAKAAAANTFRKPCITARGLSGSYVSACSARTGWCRPAVALNGTPAAAQAAMKRGHVGRVGDRLGHDAAGADLGPRAAALAARRAGRARSSSSGTSTKAARPGGSAASAASASPAARRLQLDRVDDRPPRVRAR